MEIASRMIIANLESKMLQKVCGAVGLVSLCAAAGVYPNTNGRCLGPGRVLGSDLLSLLAFAGPIESCATDCEAIAQGGALRLAAVADGCS
jgi:hypothetical protein